MGFHLFQNHIALFTRNEDGSCTDTVLLFFFQQETFCFLTVLFEEGGLSAVRRFGILGKQPCVPVDISADFLIDKRMNESSHLFFRKTHQDFIVCSHVQPPVFSWVISYYRIISDISHLFVSFRDFLNGHCMR